MTKTAPNYLAALITGVLAVALGTAGAFAQNAQPSGAADTADNPVAQVRNARSWEYGPFVNYGVGVGDRSSYKFLWAGAQLGKAIGGVHRAGLLSGQFELNGSVMPLWQAYTPAPHEETFHCCGGTTWVAPVGGGTYYGVSITPVVFRWNFLTSSRKVQPWFQGAGGLIYTTHKFPGVQQVPHGTPGGTSVWNFTPQGGAGFHYYVRPRRSVDFAVNAVHISSASLGDRNPGVNASFQFQVGYTYWK